MTKKELQPQFVINPLTVNDLDEATEMRLQSWLDTYPNEDFGVSREWVEQRNKAQMSDEKRAQRKERFLTANTTGWVGRNKSGKIIAAITPYVDDKGLQHVGSLYVDKSWHGTGIASALMQKAIDWFDPKKDIELGVVDYNERAKAFYRKWDFEQVSNSESLFDNKIPEVRMVRKAKT